MQVTAGSHGQTVTSCILPLAAEGGAGTPGPYWGDIHIHTKLSHDGYMRNILPWIYQN